METYCNPDEVGIVSGKVLIVSEWCGGAQGSQWEYCSLSLLSGAGGRVVAGSGGHGRRGRPRGSLGRGLGRRRGRGRRHLDFFVATCCAGRADVGVVSHGGDIGQLEKGVQWTSPWLLCTPSRPRPLRNLSSCSPS